MNLRKLEQELRIRVLKSMANANRLQVIDLLEDGPLSVGEIVERSQLEQSLISHTLKFLEKNHLVTCKKRGKFVFYSLNRRTVSPILKGVGRHISQFQFATLSTHVHRFDCRACIEIPRMIIAGENIKDYVAVHTCGCQACISNIELLVKKKSLSAFREDHTCECAACVENQYYLLKYVNKQLPRRR